jgi:hypothetical protein
MKRVIRGAVVAGLLGFVAAAASPACVEYPQSVVVTKVVVPTPPEQDKGNFCTVDPESPGLVSGKLDVFVRQNYRAQLVVTNQLRPAYSKEKGRVEANNVYLLGATVRLTTVDGLPLDGGALRSGNEYTVQGSGFIPATDSNAGGTGSIEVSLIDLAAATTLLNRLKGDIGRNVVNPVTVVLAYVRVNGQTLGGLKVESQEFQFPIEVCAGCLLAYKEEAPGLGCAPRVQTAGSSTVAKPPCEPGQDQPVDCNDCLGSSPYCQNKTIPK